MFDNLSRFNNLVPEIAPQTLSDLEPKLRIYQDDRLEIWFSPMGQLAEDVKLWILGITPGWQQMRIAYATAAQALRAGRSPAQAVKQRKPEVAYAGSMRANLVAMMDQVGFPHSLGVDSSSELFGSALLRTGSVLKYPVFRDGKNYTGPTPKPINHPALRAAHDQ